MARKHTTPPNLKLQDLLLHAELNVSCGVLLVVLCSPPAAASSTSQHQAAWQQPAAGSYWQLAPTEKEQTKNGTLVLLGLKAWFSLGIYWAGILDIVGRLRCITFLPPLRQNGSPFCETTSCLAKTDRAACLQQGQAGMVSSAVPLSPSAPCNAARHSHEANRTRHRQPF